jgi:hypothetical protein
MVVEESITKDDPQEIVKSRSGSKSQNFKRNRKRGGDKKSGAVEGK